MSGCEQEMCPNWDGWGCPCDVLDLEKPRRCPDCGNAEGMCHSMWDGWTCSICDWADNPL